MVHQKAVALTLGLAIAVLSSATPSYAFGKKRAVPAPDPQTAWDGNMVFYVTGGPISTQPGSVNDAAAELRDEVLSRYPSAFFYSDHNSNWQSMCDAIKSRRQLNPSGHLAIMGHSYGASATTVISRCVREAGVTVDVAVMLDMIHRPGDASPDIIPDNVSKVVAFYQHKDLVLRGEADFYREDGSQRDITATEVTENLGLTPHFGMVTQTMLNTHVAEDAVLDAFAN